MDFAFTQTQLDLRDAARRYLGDRYPIARIEQLADASTLDKMAWPELVRQGWVDPDLALIELAVLAEEGGRVLHPTPWWTTSGLAVPVFDAAGVPLPGPATLADGSAGCQAVEADGGWLVDGEVPGVPGVGDATEIVVAARTDAGVALFGVRPDQPGVTRTTWTGLDSLRGLGTLTLAGAPARLLVAAPLAAPLLASVSRRGSALLAAEGVGVADRALSIAVEYAKTREQFDRPIGSYQAVGHLLAESYAELELARSLAYRAACAIDDAADDAEEALACAVHASRRAAMLVCENAMQVCGGIGVTWEFPLHRWYRRALWLDAYHSGRPDPLDTLADALLG